MATNPYFRKAVRSEQDLIDDLSVEVIKINGFDKVLSDPNVLDAGLFISEGSRIDNVTVGGERSGFIISTGSDGVNALQNAKKAEALLSIEYFE